MAKVITECSGIPANDSERKAIAFFRDHLPDSWLLFHNFEMRQGREVFELDIALLGPYAVYLVDVKGTMGRIDVFGSKWYPENRTPFHSPLAKLRNHAKVLASIIKDSNPGQRDLGKAQVQAVILLTADDAIIQDQANLDSPDVTTLKRCLKYLNDTSRIPAHRLQNIQRFHSQISKAITGKAKSKSSALVFRDWQVEEELGGDEFSHCIEYRAKHSRLGKSGGMVRLQVFQADPYQDEAVRAAEFQKISNAYKAVAHMPSHSNILAVKDLFYTDDEDKVVLVTEDAAGKALRVYLQKSTLALTFDQKLGIMRNVLTALDHAHKHEVIHRNLTPDAIILTKGGLARVTGFDYARVGKDRVSTIAHLIVDDLDSNERAAYQAPECYRDPREASIASDLYSIGLVFYELLLGEKPFADIDQMMEADGKFPVKPSEHKPDIAKGFDDWLQKFCEFDVEDRYSSAAVARKALNDLILPEAKDESSKKDDTSEIFPEDMSKLQRDYVLGDRFRIQDNLGSGGFAVVYKVFDLLGDVVRVIKLVTRDRRSVYQRLRREYTSLLQMPEHPHVVKVIWADRFNDKDQTPYIVFDYVDGLEVTDLINTQALSLDDSIQLIRQAAEGLAHLHTHGVYHQDIKPGNLLFTDDGVRIIDFNVAVSEKGESRGGGGTKSYLPPDYDFSVTPTSDDRIDRDLYALGITFYECLSGKYPFKEHTPNAKKKPLDIKQFKECSDLSSGLLQVLYKMIDPLRSGRYPAAVAFLKDLEKLKGKYRSLLSTNDLTDTPQLISKIGLAGERPNFNPFVSHLLTLYSQSQVSNAGTRGLDEIGKATYVPTFLDNKLQPALLKGEFKLVIISGNAGDGKTAFIQQFEAVAEGKGAKIKSGANGAVFKLKGYTFQSNYDGSQDEGDEQNDTVLLKFFEPFKGDKSTDWPGKQSRIIAINEGRLVDFFLEHEANFPLLAQKIQVGLTGEPPEGGVAVINLNLRSVVAETREGKDAIFERLVSGLIKKEYWEACASCDIKDKCYAHHNACTFQDSTFGNKVIKRLKMLYTITHLRGRLHITMRDLRSALAFMLVGIRDCEAIHRLYLNSDENSREQILSSFYFNSWLGGSHGSADRLVALLREIDIAEVSNPALDRELGFLSPDMKKNRLFSFSRRSGYDQELLKTLFQELPKDYSFKNRQRLITFHQDYLALLRRRYFFECRDHSWKDMLPYDSVSLFMGNIKGTTDADSVKTASILQAINRGEGLRVPGRLGNQLALRVRKVDKGTIRSYRLFPGDCFTLQPEIGAGKHPFLECLPQHLILNYESKDGYTAVLTVNLDVFEMLMRLNSGYRPSVEEEAGYYLSLSVFKNILSAAPYQQVILTENSHDFYQISRDDKGVLHLAQAGGRDS